MDDEKGSRWPGGDAGSGLSWGRRRVPKAAEASRGSRGRSANPGLEALDIPAPREFDLGPLSVGLPLRFATPPATLLRTVSGP